MSDPRTWLTGSAIGGLMIWLGALLFWWQRPPNLLATIELLLMLALLVNTPLALSLITGPKVESPSYRWAIHLQPFAALTATWALLSLDGWPAGLLTVPWLIFAGLLALSALLRLSQFRTMPAAGRIRLAAMFYLPIGAAWLLAYQLGLQPLGFRGVIVLLTAVHFHFTGFAATIWVSQIGEHLTQFNRLYSWAAASFVSATPMIAVGITLSPLFEIAGVLLLTGSLLLLALLLYRLVIPQLPNPIGKGLLVGAPLAMLIAITLAVIYGIGEYRQLPLLTIPQMVQWHGWLNAVGFVFCGLLGWRIELFGSPGDVPFLETLKADGARIVQHCAPTQSVGTREWGE